MDGQSIGSEVAAAVTHNSDSQQVLGKGARLGLDSRRTRYTVTQNEANTDTRVVSGDAGEELKPLLSRSNCLQ